MGRGLLWEGWGRYHGGVKIERVRLMEAKAGRAWEMLRRNWGMPPVKIMRIVGGVQRVRWDHWPWR